MAQHLKIASNFSGNDHQRLPAPKILSIADLDRAVHARLPGGIWLLIALMAALEVAVLTWAVMQMVSP